jgi:hypothetical protein
MAHPSEPDHPSRREELNLRPGTQSGWDLPLEGEERCRAFGHELGNVLEMPNGLLVAYCVRCPERFEATWFRGGTAVPLAEEMVKETMAMKNPSRDVIVDLQQVMGLLTEDRSAIDSALHKVRVAIARVQKKSK